MKNAITEMAFNEVQNVSGGVIQGPDGKGCTEHGPVLSPIGNTLQGGPASVDLSLFG